MVTLYNVISSDGFIARKDGSEDFIPDDLWQEFLTLCGQYDVLVLGKGAYDAIQKYDAESIEAFEALPIKKIVVSRSSESIKSGYVLVHSPQEAFADGGNLLVCSGPTLNTSILEQNLADKIILRKLDVAIGEGIEPFPHDFYEQFASKIEINEKG